MDYALENDRKVFTTGMYQEGWWGGGEGGM